MLEKLRKIKLSSVSLIPLSFLAAILIGTLLLILPVSSADGIRTPFTDALFTATTSVCVTGLVTVDTYSHWSLFGHIVILILIQVGGLGVITVVLTLMHLMRKRFSLSEKLLLRDALNLDSLSDLLEFLGKLVKGTLAAELIGAILYMFAFVPRYGLKQGIWASVFTAVSAFCNAGIDILGPDSLAPYSSSPLVLIVTMILIITGGLGYVVWFDLYNKTKAGIKQSFSPAQILKSFSEHTKLVLTLTFALILIGGLGFLTWDDIRCYRHRLRFYSTQSKIIITASAFLIGLPFLYLYFTEFRNLPAGERFLSSLFQAVTPRTAGFNTADYTAFSDGGIAVTIGLMLIGGAPGSTAGGMKITTICVLMISMMSYFVSLVSIEWIKTVLEKISFMSYYENFTYGILSITDVVFFLSVIALFLFFTVRALEKRRWS